MRVIAHLCTHHPGENSRVILPPIDPDEIIWDFDDDLGE